METPIVPAEGELIALGRDPEIKRIEASMNRQQELAEEITQKFPGMAYITAFVMAGDVMSAQRAREMLESGEWDAERAVWLTGTYSRLDFALELVGENHLTQQWLVDHLPELWRGSDPNDTDPRYLRMWYRAWRMNDYQPLTDGRSLPRHRMLGVYRGQQPDEPVGMAWTLDPKIARKFALGVGGRTPTESGVMLKGMVARRQVLAYLTGRGESEVVADPRSVEIVAQKEVRW